MRALGGRKSGDNRLTADGVPSIGADDRAARFAAAGIGKNGGRPAPARPEARTAPVPMAAIAPAVATQITAAFLISRPPLPFLREGLAGDRRNRRAQVIPV